MATTAQAGAKLAISLASGPAEAAPPGGSTTVVPPWPSLARVQVEPVKLPARWMWDVCVPSVTVSTPLPAVPL